MIEDSYMHLTRETLIQKIQVLLYNEKCRYIEREYDIFKNISPHSLWFWWSFVNIYAILYKNFFKYTFKEISKSHWKSQTIATSNEYFPPDLWYKYYIYPHDVTWSRCGWLRAPCVEILTENFSCSLRADVARKKMRQRDRVIFQRNHDVCINTRTLALVCAKYVYTRNEW